MPIPETLKEKIAGLPSKTGVYIMKGHDGNIIYVGKAKNLRSRVRSYFSSGGDSRAFVGFLDELLGDIEILLVGSEQEALLLENELIKKHRPRFNILLRDDKDFLTLRIDLSHRYPRITIGRRPGKDGARYFGPFAGAPAVRRTQRMVNKYFKLRTCSDSEMKKRTRPCLQHQIDRCSAPCVKEVPEYSDNVSDAILFLEGRYNILSDTLRSRMLAASESLNFEEAAKIRDQIMGVNAVLEKQRVVCVNDTVERNAIGFYREGPGLAVQILEIRNGRLSGGRNHIFSNQEFPTAELLDSLLMQIFSMPGIRIPEELLIPIDIEGRLGLEEWLSERRGGRVRISIPERGDKKRIIELAEENARTAYQLERAREADDLAVLKKTWEALNLRRLPARIECYDISQIQGKDPAGSCVALLNGRPDKSRYRKYRIRSVSGQDDYAMMREVLERRLKKGMKQDDLPDLIVVDGGRGQLGVACAILSDLGLEESIDVVALAKSRAYSAGIAYKSEAKTGSKIREGDSDIIEAGKTIKYVLKKKKTQQFKSPGQIPAFSPERVFLPGKKDPVILPADSSELLLLTRLRDEAHRFAITFHRKERSRNFLNSMEKIPGVGPERRKKLLRAFGSLKKIREATPEKIAGLPGFSPKLASRIIRHLHPDQKKSDVEDP